MAKIVSFLLTLFLICRPGFSQDFNGNTFNNQQTNRPVRLYEYKIIEREHTYLENVKNIGIVYGLAWVFYPIVQPKVFNGAGGWRDYKKNLGKVVFDKDEPFWNFFVHPLTGSQLYLLYRADGYTRMESFGMTFITSALFEFTIEIFTEPASIQDLYQTPVLGSVIGLGIEKLSLYSLNTGNTLGKIFGHIINPATLLPIYQGRTLIIPLLEPKDKGASIQFEVSF